MLDAASLRFVCEYRMVYVCRCVHMPVCMCAYSLRPRKVFGVFLITLISEADCCTIWPESSKDLPSCSTTLNSVKAFRRLPLSIPFTWTLRIKTGVPVLTQQALYQENHLPSPQLFYTRTSQLKDLYIILSLSSPLLPSQTASEHVV